MIIYYDNSGQIYYAVPDDKVYWFRHKTQLRLNERHIAETEENRELCNDLLRESHKMDINGVRKYFMDSDTPTTREDFQEATE